MSKDLLSHIPSVSLVPENLLSLDAFAGLHSTPGSIDLQSQEEKYETQQRSKFTKFILSVSQLTGMDADRKSKKVLPSLGEIEDAIRAYTPLIANVWNFGLNWFPEEKFPAP